MEKKKKPSELEKFLTKKVFNKKAEAGAAAALSIGDLIYDTYIRYDLSFLNNKITIKFLIKFIIL